MFANLRFMVVSDFDTNQQLHLEHLDKLKTLFIVRCDLRDTHVSCFPKSLEGLCIWSCAVPKSLNFSKHTNLRKLDISGGGSVTQIVPNTISRLSYLTTLHLNVDWLWCSSSDEILIPKFNEISKLTLLTSLKIFWSDCQPSQDTNIFSNLVDFDIRVGSFEDIQAHVKANCVAGRKGKEEWLGLEKLSKKLIWLSGKLQFQGFQVLVERAEKVILSKTDVNVSEIWYRNRKAFKDLRYLYIEDCDTMKYVARISQKEIPSGLWHWQQSSFSKVTTLTIRTCSALKCLFSSSIATCLVELQYLNISACHAMEVIVIDEKGTHRDGDILTFSKLKSLKLLNLSSLKSFCAGMKDIRPASRPMTENSAHFVQTHPLFDGTVDFPSLEYLKIRELNVSEIWKKGYYSDASLSSSYPKLKKLNISHCPGLKNVFQYSSMARNLIMHLEKIKVQCCNMMRDIIGAGEQKEISDDGVIVFPELTVLNLQDLPNLSSLWCYGQANTYKVEFPNLVKFVLSLVEINLETMEFNQLRHLHMVENDKEIPIPSSTTWQLPSYNLEKLILGGSFSILLNLALCFDRVNHLRVSHMECSTLFSLPVLAGLQQLKELRISDSDLLEEILEDVRDDEVSDMETIILSRLELVVLKDLPHLKTFIHGANFRLHLPALKILDVTNCGLSSLFTCSVVRGLQKLENLTVLKCNLLEGIVAEKRSRGQIITLPRLHSVTFDDLPNLKSFSLSCAFNIPRLISFELKGCPHLEYFTPLKTSTRPFYICSEWHHKKRVTHLNDYIRRYHKLCETAEHQPLKMSFFSYAWSFPGAC